jgi:hypothetical protein
MREIVRQLYAQHLVAFLLYADKILFEEIINKEASEVALKFQE